MTYKSIIRYFIFFVCYHFLHVITLITPQEVIVIQGHQHCHRQRSHMVLISWFLEIRFMFKLEFMMKKATLLT